MAAVQRNQLATSGQQPATTVGLTLIELVVAMTMFALLGTALVVTLRNGLRTWDRVQQVSERESQLRWLQRVVGGDLEQVVLLTDTDELLPQFTAQSLTVVTVEYNATDARSASASPRLLRTEVAVEAQADDTTAIVRYVAPFPADPRGSFGRKQILIESLSEGTLDYLYRDANTGELIWQPVWRLDPEKPALPRAIRLTLRSTPTRSRSPIEEERTDVFSLPLGVVGTTELPP